MKYLSGLTAALVALGAASFSHASSHREAPFIAGQPKVDATDLYMFRSYEAGRAGFVTLIANYQPFQDPQGGPNFYMFDPKALYEIHIDNNGDGAEDLTLQFQFSNTSRNQALQVGDRMTPIPLINSGTVTERNDASLNVRETYSVQLVRGDRRSGTRSDVIQTGANGGTTFDKPVDNIGEKTFPSGYAAYALRHMYNVRLQGCDTPARMFVGQRKESFYIAVGKIFDLFNLNPLGPEVGGNNNDLEAKNVSTIAVELPISCIRGTDPVIGAFTTASVRQSRLINPTPASGLGNATEDGGAWAQVSRLGMPLVNEVVIGLPDKDRFNHSSPNGDGQFLNYVTHPSLPTLIESLFPAAQAPTNFPRTDLVAAFLTGIQGVNKPANVVPAELLRLNVTTPPTPEAQQNPLGVIEGDSAGFPNGRRPADDIVDVTLRVAMGVLCRLTTAEDTLNVGCKPRQAPSGNFRFTDGVRKTASDYRPGFPYLLTPLPGNFNPPPPPGSMTNR